MNKIAEKLLSEGWARDEHGRLCQPWDGDALYARRQPRPVAKARELASSEDYYEMDACGATYETCVDKACIHTILLRAASR